jgi:hypothetical protein
MEFQQKQFNAVKLMRISDSSDREHSLCELRLQSVVTVSQPLSQYSPNQRINDNCAWLNLISGIETQQSCSHADDPGICDVNTIGLCPVNVSKKKYTMIFVGHLELPVA